MMSLRVVLSDLPAGRQESKDLLRDKIRLV